MIWATPLSSADWTTPHALAGCHSNDQSLHQGAVPDTDHYHHDSYHSNHDHVVANGYQEVVVVVVVDVVVLVKREIGRKGR